MITKFLPVSKWAKENFDKYKDQFKLARETGSQLLFVNKECQVIDGNLDSETFKFGFWVYKHDDVRIIRTPDSI